MSIDAMGSPPTFGAGPDEGALFAGRYRLVSALGRGRASTVYLAHDERIGNRPVVVKVSSPRPGGFNPSAAREHLEAEARALGVLSHPAAPRLNDVLTRDERIALVMEYLPGQTLRAALIEGPVAEGDALEWGLLLCDLLLTLHVGPPPLTHGAIGAEHCVLLPRGRLVLFDWGTAAAATDAGRQRDARLVAMLVSALLAGHEGAEDAARRASSRVSAATAEALRGTLHRAPPAAPLTILELRRVLIACYGALGINRTMCPYCLVRVRSGARHCGACGATLLHELSAPPAAPVTPPPDPTHGETVGLPGSRLPPGLESAAGALASATHRTRLAYTNRLRAIGHYLDQQGLRRVTIVDSDSGVFIRGQSDGVGRPAASTIVRGSRAARDAFTAILDEAELAELGAQARRRRDAPDGPRVTRPAIGLLGSPLFPSGYEDRLRALGVELDGLSGVRLLTIIEVADHLYLDYDRTDEDLAGGVAHQHLVLRTGDMEAIVQAAVARRGKGSALRRMIGDQGSR